MVAIHDYLCASCGSLFENEIETPSCECGGVPEITFSTWHSHRFNSVREFKSENDLVDDNGKRRRFLAREDPIAMIEVGLQEGSGLRTFNAEQSQYYGEKLMREDSPALRKEILRQRKKNLDAKGIPSPDVM